MKIKKQAVRFVSAWSESRATTFGAAVAYYTVFSMAPLLLIATSVAGLIIDSTVIHTELLLQFQSVFGNDSALFIESLMNSQVSSSTNVTLIIVGVFATLLGAMGVFSGLQAGLDAIFSTLPSKEENGIWKIILQKIYSLGMVLSLGFVLVVSLIMSALFNAFSQAINEFLPGGYAVSSILEFSISFVLITLFLGCVLKILPSERLGWKPALKGGLFAGILFIVGKYALAAYLAHSSVTSAYGAASSVVLLILWAYYLSLAFFLSAIITRLYFL